MCEYALLPCPKDLRPAFTGARWPRLDGAIAEYSWCMLLSRVRATCRAALKFHNDKGEMEHYLRTTKFRKTAYFLHTILTQQRVETLSVGRLLPTHSRYLSYNSEIDETWDTVENDVPGFPRRLLRLEDAAGLR